MSQYLVIAPSWLGDLIMAQSLFIALKKREDGASLTLFAPPFMRPLVERMPEVDEFIPNPLRHGELNLRLRWQIARELKARHFDRAYVLPNSLKSALIPFWAGIPERIGFKGESRYLLLNRMRTNKEDFPRMVERYVALACDRSTVRTAADLPPFACPALATEPPSAQLLTRLKVATDRPLLALGCGANYGPAKLWPVEYFAEISNRWIRRGGRVLGLGTDKDLPTVEAIADRIDQSLKGYFYTVAGQTNLIEALDLTACCSAAVCNDSGLMHTVAAVGVPQICIFGSTSTGYTPPLSDKARCLESNEPCHPCFERTCKRGDYACLRGITPDAVWTALLELLEAS